MIVLKKLLYLPLFMMLGLCYSTAQENTTVISHYIFPEFTKGTVLNKDGKRINALLNYNTITQEMLFLKDNTPMAISNRENIDTVFILNRAFIPVEKEFYEQVTHLATPFFVKYFCRVIPPADPVGYGSTSQTTSVTQYKSLVTSTEVYKLQLPVDYKIVPEESYWLRINGSFQRISNSKQIMRLFPAKESEIKQYIKTHKIRFNNREELVRLIKFCEE
jgi:hypothetical protein